VHLFDKQAALNLFVAIKYFTCLQCFDAVGWAAGRAYSL